MHLKGPRCIHGDGKLGARFRGFRERALQEESLAEEYSRLQTT